MKKKRVAMNGNHLTANLPSRFVPTMLLRVRSKATSIAVCTRFGFIAMRREIQTITQIVSALASST